MWTIPFLRLVRVGAGATQCDFTHPRGGTPKRTRDDQSEADSHPSFVAAKVGKCHGDQCGDDVSRPITYDAHPAHKSVHTRGLMRCYPPLDRGIEPERAAHQRDGED